MYFISNLLKLDELSLWASSVCRMAPATVTFKIQNSLLWYIVLSSYQFPNSTIPITLFLFQAFSFLLDAIVRVYKSLLQIRGRVLAMFCCGCSLLWLFFILHVLSLLRFLTYGYYSRLFRGFFCFLAHIMIVFLAVVLLIAYCVLPTARARFNNAGMFSVYRVSTHRRSVTFSKTAMRYMEIIWLLLHICVRLVVTVV